MKAAIRCAGGRRCSASGATTALTAPLLPLQLVDNLYGDLSWSTMLYGLSSHLRDVRRGYAQSSYRLTIESFAVLGQPCQSDLERTMNLECDSSLRFGHVSKAMSADTTHEMEHGQYIQSLDMRENYVSNCQVWAEKLEYGTNYSPR